MYNGFVYLWKAAERQEKQKKKNIMSKSEKKRYACVKVVGVRFKKKREL